MTLKPEVLPDTTADIPFDTGHRALLDGSEPVIVVTVEGDRRYVTLTPSPDVWIRNAEGKLVLNRQWVNVERLKSAAMLVPDAPITIAPDPASALEALPHEPVDIDAMKAHMDIDGADSEAVIAGQEMDLAAQRDEQAAYIAELEQAHEIARDYIEKLEAQRHLTLEAVAGRDAVLERAQQMTARRKIETTTYPDIDDGSLTDFINQGWRVVFEAAYVLPAYDREVCHMVRLERETQDTAHPPMEARAAAGIPAYEDIPGEMSDDETPAEPDPYLQVEEIYIQMDGGEPAWKSEIDPVKREAMIYAARSATVGKKAAGRMIAQTRARQKRQREQGGAPDIEYLVGSPKVNGLRVGKLALDPAKFPLLNTLASGVTGDELIDAMNEKVKARVMAAMLAAQPQRPSPVPLMLGQ